MKQNLHGRLIAAAAKRHLSPLGCRRKGQSRFWSADHGFYQIGIEFQPSGWSKGSYLNEGGAPKVPCARTRGSATVSGRVPEA